MSTWWKDASDLIQEQADILEVPADKSILIQGPPGSGKTNLLLLRANYLALSGQPNLHVVVFGGLLRSFIQIGGVQYKFPPEKVVTHARLFDSILRENNIFLSTASMPLPDARKARADAVRKLLDSGKIGFLYDALLLDEAQDYTPEEIEVFSRIAPIIIATADERQKVYNVEDCMSALLQCTDIHYPLKHHFRNGREICLLADGVNKGIETHTPLITHSQYNESSYPSKVFDKASLSIEAQAQAIHDQILDQMVGYPNDHIGIMCPRNEELIQIYGHLLKLGIGDLITCCWTPDFNPEKPVWLSTISAGKGLEFRCVHLAGLDYLSKTGAAQRRLTYTGITRAKTALSLYYEKRVPGYLESSLKSLQPVEQHITKNKIFGKE